MADRAGNNDCGLFWTSLESSLCEWDLEDRKLLGRVLHDYSTDRPDAGEHLEELERSLLLQIVLTGIFGASAINPRILGLLTPGALTFEPSEVYE
jgi:hypothetical protein